MEEATVVGEVVSVVPSNFIVIVDEAANPVPDTVTVVPVGPPVGDRVIDEVTENEAEAD